MHGGIKILRTGRLIDKQVNVSNFIKFLQEKMKLPEKDIFAFNDLFEGKNMKQFVISMFAFARRVYSVPGFLGPTPVQPEAKGEHIHSPVATPSLIATGERDFSRDQPKKK